jgi:hypothetical protein
MLVRLNCARVNAMASTRKDQRNRQIAGRQAGADNAAHSDHLVSSKPSDGNGDFIDQTVSIWQKHAKRQLTRQDGREIIDNMSGFFRVLREWDRSERRAKTSKRPLATECSGKASSPEGTAYESSNLAPSD